SKPVGNVAFMATILPAAVAIDLKLTAATRAFVLVHSFPLHKIEVGIPPFVPAGIRAEPFRFMPENLVYLLAATLAKTCSRFQWVNCLRSGGRTSTDVIPAAV
ncbi:MAG: hypothetical protein K2K53_10100, partial [Oscillospiraceae bacterium]|nr:hypothetical protein [Oscillospiraceae bacterium]